MWQTQSLFPLLRKKAKLHSYTENTYTGRVSKIGKVVQMENGGMMGLVIGHDTVTTSFSNG